MRGLGLRKSFYVPLAAFFMLFLCFLLFQLSKPIQRGESSKIGLSPPSTQYSRRLELAQVLSRASMQDRTIILTMLAGAWASPGSILDVFLQSFKVGEGTRRFLNHLVIITMDAQAFEYCVTLHPHCIHPSTFAHYFAAKNRSNTSPAHNLFSWKRNNVVLEVLQLGYNIIFTEADVMWLRSPLPHFHPGNELTISCDISSDEPRRGYMPDGGLFFLKANAIAIEFFRYLKLMKVLYPNSLSDESLCETVKGSQEIAEAFGFREKLVDTAHFSGFCQLNKDTVRKAYTMHANCCDDLKSKVHDLRLVLDDWMHFRTGLAKFNASKPKALRWRAPKSCMGL